MKLSTLFLQKPDSWGLRGDPFLWDELKQYATKLDIPTSESELRLLLETLFAKSTGCDISGSGETVYVDRFAKGGMSSGHISLGFWREQAIPLLLERYSKRRFTLIPGYWYAAEFIGEEFGNEIRSNSPIRVDGIAVQKSGRRQFTLAFNHANYPEGVRDKKYTLITIERSTNFLLSRSLEHDPARLLLIYDISWKWLENHPEIEGGAFQAVQDWLDRK